jgi:hypothetical protein
VWRLPACDLQKQTQQLIKLLLLLMALALLRGSPQRSRLAAMATLVS